MSSLKIAIPSDAPGGLEAGLCPHFGHCDLYTIVEMTENGSPLVGTLDNPPHQEGGCLAPVGRLAQNGVKILLAGGMGRRPLAGFNQAGIEVYLAAAGQTVGQALKEYLAGRLPVFSLDNVCGGGGGCAAH